VAFGSRLLPFGLVLLLGGCASEALPTSGDGGSPSSATDADQAVADAVLGVGQGPAALVTIYDPSDDDSGRTLVPTALAWNPTEPDELWITLREPPTERTCTTGMKTACPWLEGRVAIVHGAASAPGTPPQIETKEDANAWHFMRRPSSLAFGSDDTFASCGEARTGNYEDESIPFNGPVLWSADPSIFGAEPPADSPTGSTHIDMLHESPYCMGIAHERDNVYWTFNGDAGSLDRYDFHVPHEPGGDDHSDGEVWRYAAGLLARVPDVPSHLAYDPETSVLFAADTGHGRIVALDTKSGHDGGDITTYDPIQTHVLMSGATLSEIVPAATLVEPTGLTLFRGVLFVTDFWSSRIVAFDRRGRLLAKVDTSLPEGSIGGIGIGSDGHAYITERAFGRVLRLDPAGSTR
jgi:sugar lactone lactonase YvrE